MSFKKDQLAMFLVSHIEQSPQTAKAWVKFILDECFRFYRYRYRTNQRLDLIVYVYTIFGAQAQAKTGILTLGMGLDAKRECLNILETLIDSPVDLQDSIQIIISRFFTIRSFSVKLCSG